MQDEVVYKLFTMWKTLAFMLVDGPKIFLSIFYIK